MHIDSWPSELIVQIVQLLKDPADRRTAAAVCSQWRAVCSTVRCRELRSFEAILCQNGVTVDRDAETDNANAKVVAIFKRLLGLGLDNTELYRLESSVTQEPYCSALISLAIDTNRCIDWQTLAHKEEVRHLFGATFLPLARRAGSLDFNCGIVAQICLTLVSLIQDKIRIKSPTLHPPLHRTTEDRNRNAVKPVPKQPGILSYFKAVWARVDEFRSKVSSVEIVEQTEERALLEDLVAQAADVNRYALDAAVHFVVNRKNFLLALMITSSNQQLMSTFLKEIDLNTEGLDLLNAILVGVDTGILNDRHLRSVFSFLVSNKKVDLVLQFISKTRSPDLKRSAAMAIAEKTTDLDILKEASVIEPMGADLIFADRAREEKDLTTALNIALLISDVEARDSVLYDLSIRAHEHDTRLAEHIIFSMTDSNEKDCAKEELALEILWTGDVARAEKIASEIADENQQQYVIDMIQQTMQAANKPQDE